MSSSSGAKQGRSHYTRDLASIPLGTPVRLCGWVEDVRALGAIVFVTIRDVKGLAQAVFLKKETPTELFRIAETLPRQSCLQLEGVVAESKAQKFPVEVRAHALRVLSLAQHPLPIDPTGRVPSSLDVRLDARTLDLRTSRVSALFRLRHHVLRSIRETLYALDFLEVTTSRIIGQAAEGGANLFKFSYFGREALLAQSPQLYKEQLTASLERVFEIGNFFRAEKFATRKHATEFTSVDMEAAYMDEEGVMGIAEEVLRNVVRDAIEHGREELAELGYTPRMPEPPFPRLTYAAAVEELRSHGKVEYGDDLTDAMLRKLGQRHSGYYWIVDWPASLKPFYIETKGAGDRLSRGFDLQHSYLELASGGMRVSDAAKLERRIAAAGLSVEAFGSHLKAFRWGMPPHAGWAIGLDRLMMVLTNQKNIREVMLYPRDRFRLTP